MAASERSAGSIADTAGRLSLWAKREGKGLAQVEYSSEFSRQRVVAQVEAELAIASVGVRAIVLSRQATVADGVQDLLRQLAAIPAGHVVWVTGFGNAFPDADALRTLNFNREALVALPLRQVWWMTPLVLQTSLYAMPDLHGWFSPRLCLTESIARVTEAGEPIETTGRRVSLDDAIARSSQLIQQFEQAQAAGGDGFEGLKTYLLPALEALAEVGAEQKLRDLTLRFEGLLSQINVTDRPEIASSLGRLGRLYLDQGRYPAAEPLLKKALSIREAQLGADHLSTATSLNNLAGLYKSQGRYAEAEPLYARSLSIHEAQLGADHPSTALSLNNLAELYRSQGRYAEAEPLYARSLSIHEAQLGAEHPDTATSLNNLAELYRSQGRYAEAEPLYARSLSIREAQLGAEHPDTATSLNNLAVLYYVTDRLPEAAQMMSEAVEICEKSLGLEHPYTIESKKDLATIQQKINQKQNSWRSRLKRWWR
jgi:tetratricopeptide (TPR) repeat protein